MKWKIDRILDGFGTKAVLFDIDGTLLDSMGLWDAIDRRFARDRSLILPKDFQMRIAGMSMVETAEYVKETFHLKDSPEDLMEIWNEMAEKAYREKIEPKKGALSLLSHLKEGGIKMGMATSNSRRLVNAAFEKTSFSPYISALVTATEIRRGKPAPDVYLACASKLSVPPASCLVFEDVVQGIRAGRAAGMKVISIDDPWSRSTLAEKKALSCLVIPDFTVLCEEDKGEEPFR